MSRVEREPGFPLALGKLLFENAVFIPEFQRFAFAFDKIEVGIDLVVHTASSD